MEKGKTFMWAESIGILTHNQRVILGNTDSGEWIKISQECYHILRKRQTMRLTLNETPLFYERRGFLHSSGSSDDQGIRSSNSAGSIFPCLSQRFGSSVRIYLK